MPQKKSDTFLPWGFMRGFKGSKFSFGLYRDFLETRFLIEQ